MKSPIFKKPKSFFKSKKNKIGLILFFLFAIFFLLNLTNFSNEVKNFFYFISLPIQKSFWIAGNKISIFFETIFEIKNLKKENEKLKFKNQELLAKISNLKELKKENEILKKALGIGLEKDFKLVFVKVVGLDLLGDSFLINKGAKDNISKNLPVISEERVLFGKVSKVEKNFSRVMLISHPESVFAGKIQKSNKDEISEDIYGIVKGNGNLEVLFDLIPSQAKIRKGDILITSALGGDYPKGLLVGKVKKIKKSDTKPFQKAKIEPFFNITKREGLFIILK